MQFSLYLFNPMHNAKYALKNNLGFNLENDIRVLTNDLDVPKLFFFVAKNNFKIVGDLVNPQSSNWRLFLNARHSNDGGLEGDD